MRWLENDRLTAVSALRRARAPAHIDATADSPRGRDQITDLLGASVARNRYGEFVRLERWFAQPEPCTNPEALRLVLPSLAEPSVLQDPEQWLFLDTETTGLAGGTGTCAFLVGLGWWERGGFQVEQLFLRDYDEEHAVLYALAERMAERPVLVTYNGKSFDWPLLDTRFRLTREIEPKAFRAHLDLLHPARALWRLEWGTARLGELERHVLGIERGPDIPGELIPQLYFDFLRGGSAEPLVPVFRHNQSDLASLAALAGHMAGLAAAPDKAHPLEQYGLSRLFERSGDRARARRIYEMAIASGLPLALGRAARRRLARLARRDGALDVAHSLWQELAEENCGQAWSNETLSAVSGEDDPAERKQTLETILEACEQLAIHAERMERNAADAILWTRRAEHLLGEAEGIDRRCRERWQARLERRLERLSRASKQAISPLPQMETNPGSRSKV
jgi:uncharacterized protein YprB with RNaseH-like and TPR domain